MKHILFVDINNVRI